MDLENKRGHLEMNFEFSTEQKNTFENKEIEAFSLELYVYASQLNYIQNELKISRCKFLRITTMYLY